MGYINMYDNVCLFKNNQIQNFDFCNEVSVLLLLCVQVPNLF